MSAQPAPHRTRRATGSLVAVLGLVTVLTAVTGCSSSADAGAGAPDQRYVSGDGTVTLTSTTERHEPIEFSGKTLEGTPYDVADDRGDVVVVNVWGSWCPPCIAEAPALQRVWEQTRDQDVAFVGVDSRDQPAAARAHQQRFGVGYPSVDDRDGRILLAFRGTLPPTAIPSTLVLDRNGRVAARVVGAVEASVLRGLIADVLAERPAGSGQQG